MCVCVCVCVYVVRMCVCVRPSTQLPLVAVAGKQMEVATLKDWITHRYLGLTGMNVT